MAGGRGENMITVQEARKKAEDSIKGTGLQLGGALDDGEYFIFGYKGEPDIPPVGIQKATGQADTYFPPEHPAFITSRRIRLS